MGNCLSKLEPIFELCEFRIRTKRGSSFQTGPMAEMRAQSMGGQIKKWRHILTPVEDRFPPQACDLKIDSFCGFLCHEKATFSNPVIQD